MGLNPISDAAVELVKSTVGKAVDGLIGKYLPQSLTDKEKEDIRLEAERLVLEEFKARNEEERIFADDRRSAREREIAVRDKTPSYLAAFSFVGFFGILVLLMEIEIPEKAHDPLMIMLGLLGGVVTGVVQYYFGSSSGSARKTSMIDDVLKGR